MKPSLTILIADDEVHIQRVLELKFTAAGFACIKVGDGTAAWKAVVEHRPDLVISDYQMPGLSGLDLAAKMYQDYDLREIPVILLTAHGFSLRPEDLRETNILHRVAKPFSPRELLDLARDLVLEMPLGG